MNLKWRNKMTLPNSLGSIIALLVLVVVVVLLITGGIALQLGVLLGLLALARLT
jgi:hypothetical protein